MEPDRNARWTALILLLTVMVCITSCSDPRRDEPSDADKLRDEEYTSDSIEYQAFMQTTDPQPPACAAPLTQPQSASYVPVRHVIRVVGVDALNWRILNLFLRHHQLPNLQRLLCSGTAAILRTDVACSPVSWTTIASGKTYAKHGIQPETALGKTPFDYTIEAVKTPRIWDIMRHYNLTAKVGSYYFTPEGFSDDPLKDQNAEVLQRMTGAYDFFISILTEIDAAQHFGALSFMFRETEWGSRYRLDRRWAAMIESQSDWLVDNLLKLDGLIGKLLDAYPNDTLIIISDHGVHAKPARITFTVDFSKIIPGSQVLTVQQGKILNMPPGISIPLTDDERYFALAEEKATEQKLYLKVIAPRLSLETAQATDKAALAKVGQAITELTIAGRKLFIPAPEGALIFNPALLPDLILKKRSDPRLETVYSLGMHDRADHGVLAAFGPDIKSGAVAGPFDLVDVAPTLLYLADLPVGRDMDGKVAAEIFRPELLAARPIAWVDSYDQLLPVNAVPDSRRTMSPEEIKRYRQLGYPGIPSP